MAAANNGNNNNKTEDATSKNVKEVVASPVKNDGMRRRKQTTANSTTEWKESKYVIPPACTYQGNVFACLNGRLSARYNPHILCTRDHDNELGISSWDDLMMHRGYENPNGNGTITPMQYENCPHSGCTKIVPSIQTSRKYHLQHDHEDVCRTLLDLEAGVETTVIRDLLHKEKLYYTATGYVTKLECKFGADCGNRRTDHLEKYTHPKKNISTNNVEECYDNVQFASECSLRTKLECKFGADCGNMRPDHLEKYTHPILRALPIKHDCKFGADCGNRRPEHLEKYTHPILRATIPIKHECKFGTDCGNMRPEHLEKYTHPKKNCRFQPNCTNKSEAHCQQFVHTIATVLKSKTVTGGYYDLLE